MHNGTCCSSIYLSVSVSVALSVAVAVSTVVVGLVYILTAIKESTGEQERQGVILVYKKKIPETETQKRGHFVCFLPFAYQTNLFNAQGSGAFCFKHSIYMEH